MGIEARHRVVAEVASHAATIGDDRHIQVTQRLSRPDARTLQQRWGMDRPAREDDLPCFDLARARRVPTGNAGDTIAVEQELFHLDTGEDCEIWPRSEEHTSELQSLMRISYAVFCLQKKTH